MSVYFVFRTVCGLFLTTVILSTAYDIRKRMLKQQGTIGNANGRVSNAGPVKLTNLKPIGAQMAKNSEKELNEGTLQTTEGESIQEQTNIYVVEVGAPSRFPFFCTLSTTHSLT